MRASASPALQRSQPLSWLQPALLVGSLLPLIWLVSQLALGGLGANPIATALNQLGLLALIFIWACLACTPLKVVFKWNWPIRVRKTLGLLGFFTALVHFLFYLTVDQGLALGKVVNDVAKRPFIAVGFLALVLLLPLALTSTKRSLQRMGFRAWKRLHRLIYLVGVLGFVHYLLRVKTHDGAPLVYGAVLGGFFLVRIGDFLRQRVRARRR